jgi:hypothetical protein
MVAEAGPRGELAAAGGVWRSCGRLADDREIIYFDESPGLGRAEFQDGRDLRARTVQAPARMAAVMALAREAGCAGIRC